MNKKDWIWGLFGIFLTLACGGYVAMSNPAWYWAVAIFITGFICLSIIGNKQKKRRIEAYFAGRPSLDDSEFGKFYFPPARAEIAAKLRTILAHHVGMDISRMNPTDRFIEDLRMDDFDSLSTVEFAIEIEKEFGIKIPDSAAEKMTTFQDVVDYVDEAVKAKTS